MDKRKTYFAPAGRDPQDLIQEEARSFEDLELLSSVLDALPEIALVLNGKRQVIFANAAAEKLLGLACAGLIGRRPGEIVSCVHAGDADDGCGTGEACRYCGAVNAILEAQRSGKAVTRDCRITARSGDTLKPLDLSVTCKDISKGNARHLLLTIRDISDSNRRKVLERTFFHDVINSVAAVQSGAALLKDDVRQADKKILDGLLSSVEFLLDEVIKQRDFLAMENGDLAVEPEETSNTKILGEVVALFAASGGARGKRLFFDEQASAPKRLYVDPILLRRVLGNMGKNALEASAEGETVRAWTAPHGENVRFSVNNPAVMPEDVRFQVFQRSFSTKGPGRGIGTYSMRMLATDYLNGTIDFRSESGEGTTFWIDIPAPIDGE